ncbi:glycoside hydrolase family 88 protein [soil metagenome]
MLKYIFQLTLICNCFFSTTFAQKVNQSNAFKEAESQVLQMLQEVKDISDSPRFFPRTFEHDTLKLVASKDWTSGFWPGILWMMYENSGKEIFNTNARYYTSLMVKELTNNDSHDVGFKVYCSYGQAYRLTNEAVYKEAIIKAAATLCTRFNSRIGCIRSWNAKGRAIGWAYPVIIDNMMNLELLFEATKLSNDSTFYNIAVSHANTTLKNHYRANFSSYHVVDYDTATGNVIKKNTAQGYADESSWARGQAWGLYGFTMCYRETNNPVYLQQAEAIAGYILNNPNLPADMIPYWDYDMPDKSTAPRDVSAATITASALYELSGYSKNSKKYLQAANKILNNVIKSYRSPLPSNHGFILLHSTGHKPVDSEVDVPIIYADYYYLEALMRSKKLK